MGLQISWRCRRRWMTDASWLIAMPPFGISNQGDANEVPSDLIPKSQFHVVKWGEDLKKIWSSTSSNDNNFYCELSSTKMISLVPRLGRCPLERILRKVTATGLGMITTRLLLMYDFLPVVFRKLWYSYAVLRGRMILIGLLKSYDTISCFLYMRKFTYCQTVKFCTGNPYWINQSWTSSSESS